MFNRYPAMYMCVAEVNIKYRIKRQQVRNIVTESQACLDSSWFVSSTCLRALPRAVLGVVVFGCAYLQPLLEHLRQRPVEGGPRILDGGGGGGGSTGGGAGCARIAKVLATERSDRPKHVIARGVDSCASGGGLGQGTSWAGWRRCAGSGCGDGGSSSLCCLCLLLAGLGDSVERRGQGRRRRGRYC